jgi:nitroreductase
MGIYRWTETLRRFPPRDFWSTLASFLIYALRQSVRAARREDGSAALASHINFKRAHYLEKAMLCEYSRSLELDENYNLLRSYLDTPEGGSDDCHGYLVKIAREYERYPTTFRCFMLDIPRKPWPASYHRILRRLIVQRRSLRRFTEQPVAPELLGKIVEAGAYAPTSCNAQPVQFLTLTDRSAIQLVFGAAAGASAWHESIPSGVLVLSDSRHYKPFQQHMIMYQDIAAATQNCLLTAEALGLAACWVSLLTDSHIEHQAEVYRKLGLPSHVVIGAAIAIGYPTNAVCLVPRRPLTSVWHKERYHGK